MSQPRSWPVPVCFTGSKPNATGRGGRNRLRPPDKALIRGRDRADVPRGAGEPAGRAWSRCMQFLQSSRSPPGCDQPRPRADPLPQVSREPPDEHGSDQAQRAPDDRRPHGHHDARLRPRVVRQPPEPLEWGLHAAVRPSTAAPDEPRGKEARPRGGAEHPDGVTSRDPTKVSGRAYLRAERARGRPDRPEAVGDALAQFLDGRVPRPGPHLCDRSLGHRSTIDPGGLSARRRRRGRRGRARRRRPGRAPACRPATRSGSPSSSRPPPPPRK